MRRTLDSVAAQTVPPALWVIVDDGSTDETPAILAEYAARLPYIRVVQPRRPRAAQRSAPASSRPSTPGYETIDPDEFDYVCKLDLDLDLPPRYFEMLMARMEADPRLGTCSGKPYFPHPRPASWCRGCGDEKSVGMTKFYRTSASADRRVRAAGHVGRHRLPPLPHAGVDGGELGRPGAALRAPAADGLEPQGHLDRPGARRLRPVLHGHRAGLHAGQRGLPPVRAPRARRSGAMLWGYAKGA